MGVSFEHNDDGLGTKVIFSVETGALVSTDENDLRQFIPVHLPKREAINLASKLLQWGTSS